MLVPIHKIPSRDLTTVDWSKITSANATVVTRDGEDFPWAVEFDQDLTQDQQALVKLFALADDNGQAIYEKALNAVHANNNFLTLTSPTNAQVLAQVELLTRECTGLIKLLLNQFADTTGT